MPFSTGCPIGRATTFNRLRSALVIGFAFVARAPAAESVDFARDIQPIFNAHCTQCHGEEKQKSGLRLDSPGAILRSGDSGEPVFIAGNSTESHIVKLVAREQPDEAMPPEGKGDPLDAGQVALFRAWIDQGAIMPEADTVALTTDHWSFQPVRAVPPPKHAEPWGTSPVDAFVLRGLKEKGLTPSPREDRATLVRRLYLVAHGLPPTPEQVADFENDTSPDAWAQLVDRVLVSPRFGERWARHWLDVVRFAESNGFETNRERTNAYHYRDYVIASLNADKPYDQFVKEQIAGDAMGVDVGTAFLVAGPYDIVKSPDINLTLMQRQDELADMVNTTGTAFLGLTIGCARCHNHKFDPILQKDYYSMQAIFAGVQQGERPMSDTLTPERKREAETLRKSVGELEEEVNSLRKRAAHAVEGEPVFRPAVNAISNLETFPPVNARFVRLTFNATSSSEACIDELEVFDTDGTNVALAANGGIPTASGSLQGYPIHKLEHLNNGLFGNSQSWIANTTSGWAAIEFPKIERIQRIQWARDRDGGFKDRVITDYVIEASVDGQTWKPLTSSADRQPVDSAADPRAFLARLDPASADRGRELLDQIKSSQTRIAELETSRTAWIGTFAQPGETHRLYRGDPMAPREAVAPDALTVTGSLGLAMDEPEQQRRIRLAEWIASPSNPLTARVIVNRLWQYTFGTGIVNTPSDFGGNGAAPTHPELLDWMAHDFIGHGWSVKHTLRVLFNSNTFTQSGKPQEKGLAIDADSRFFWRFPPRRVEAEVIRDSILAVTGALENRVGGPGFYLLNVDRENVVHYFPKEETGPEEWRRMIYMFKIRQEQDAVFGSFDCPDGNQVIPTRSSSTTPLQALNLFNSRFVVQQAELLANRLIKDAGATPKAQIARAFTLLYGRDPDAAEIDDSLDFIKAEGLDAWCRAMLNTNELLFIF
jgi:mono/diheme cytochrome c family protein